MFDLKNSTRNLTTSNLFYPGNTTLNSAGYPVYTVSTHVTGDAANYATNGTNDLALIEGDVTVAKTSVVASCETGSIWNGQMCIPPKNPPILPPTPNRPTAKITNCIIPL